MARSSRPIWEGPSQPMDTPAWEPTNFRFGLGILGHADLVEGPGQKGRKGRDKGDLAPGGQAQPHVGHVLFGDVHLEKTVRAGLGKGFRHGGVADFPVQADNVDVAGPQAGQGVAVGLAGGHLGFPGIINGGHRRRAGHLRVFFFGPGQLPPDI